jgi:RNA recognition motif-containing protein
MKLWIANIAPGTSDDELREFVKKYGPELECTRIQREDGDGSRPAAGLEFTGTSKALGNLCLRLNGMYWKGRELTCATAMAV